MCDSNVRAAAYTPYCMIRGTSPCTGYARLRQAHDKLDRERDPLRRALARSARELVLLRDDTYDNVTNAEGEYGSDEDRESVEYLDRLIDEACRALGCDVAGLTAIAATEAAG